MAYQPKGKTFDQFETGQVYETAARTITEADVVLFAGLSGDWNPLHTNEEFARGTPFGARIAHGALILSIATGLANQLGIFEGTTIGVLEFLTTFTGAVKPGDTVHVRFTVEEKRETKKPDRGIVKVGINVINQREEAVLGGHWLVMLYRRGDNHGTAEG